MAKNVLFPMNDKLHTRLRAIVKETGSTMPFVAQRLLEQAIKHEELIASCTFGKAKKRGRKPGTKVAAVADTE